MKWFKHISDSLDDPFIFDLVATFGGDGYLVFFGCLEVLAREFDPISPETCTVSERFLTKKLQLSRHKMVKILSFCEKNKRIFATYEKGIITLNCPKFMEMCDEWSRKQLRSNSGLTPKKLRLDLDLEGEEEEDKKKKPPYAPLTTPESEQPKAAARAKPSLSVFQQEQFDQFWESYPRKVGKGAAVLRWAKIKPDRVLHERIIAAVERQRQSQAWMRDGGQYIPNPATWLNQQRWDDELDDKANDPFARLRAKYGEGK